MTNVDRLGVSSERIADVCRRHGITELGLFGSTARGDSRTDSDVDLLVTFRDDARVTLWDLNDIQVELEAVLGRPVDLVNRAALRNPFRRRSILRDLTVLYAA